jgi:hypothetical protein
LPSPVFSSAPSSRAPCCPNLKLVRLPVPPPSLTDIFVWFADPVVGSEARVYLTGGRLGKAPCHREARLASDGAVLAIFRGWRPSVGRTRPGVHGRRRRRSSRLR